MHRNVNPHARKRETPRPPLKAAGAAGLSHSRLLYIKDNISNYRFLIDTGAEVSVLPASPAECRQQHSDFSLVAVNQWRDYSHIWKTFRP